MNQRRNFSKTRRTVTRRNLRKIKNFYRTFGHTRNISIPNDYLEVPEQISTPVQNLLQLSYDNDANDENIVDYLNLDSVSNNDHADESNSDNIKYYKTENIVLKNMVNDTQPGIFQEKRDEQIENSAYVTNNENYNESSTKLNVQNSFSSNINLIPTRHLSVQEHILSVVALSLRHHTSYKSVLDTFRYTNLSVGTNILPTTKTALWKALDQNDSHILRYFYCRECNDFLGLKSSITNQVENDCCCKACGPGKPEIYLGYFLYNNLTSQIQKLLTLPNIIQALKYRFERKKTHIGALEDIYDGAEYQKLSSSGFLKEWYNFSLTFTTGGAKTANSSNTRIWPVFAQINEFPPHMRKQHMLLAAVYVDSKHPVMNNFLRTFVEELRNLYENGIAWRLSDGTQITSRVIVTTSSLDTPTRSAVTRMTQFNGYFGCLFCYAKGKTVKSGKLVYPIDQSYKKLRLKSELISDMHEAFKTGNVVNGVEGISSLIALPLFKINKGVVVEALNSIYHGVVRLHTKLILSHTKKSYYVGSPDSCHVIDQCLLRIKPPTRHSRKPRSISIYKHWKASEWRNWLDYAPICLQNVLDRKFVNHMAHLSEAVYYLNNHSITLAELDRAETLLKQYVQLFQKYFGIDNMSSDVHSLTHIVQKVRDWGPMWAHSSFVFEFWNENLLDHMTSSHCSAEQIITRFLMEKYLITCSSKNTIPIQIREFIQKTLKIPLFNDEIELIPKFYGQGKFTTRLPTDEEVSALSIAGYSPVSLTCFQKMTCNRIKYFCENKKNNLKLGNSIICDDNGLYGEIQTIVQFHHENITINGLFMFRFMEKGHAFNTKHITRVKLSNNLVFISETTAIKPACLIENSNDCYIIRLANYWESD